MCGQGQNISFTGRQWLLVDWCILLIHALRNTWINTEMSEYTTEGVQKMEFVNVLGMPTCVLKYGVIKPETKAIFLVIPGNPGVIEFYDCFISHLYDNCNQALPVWGVSHAGHVQPEGCNQALYKMLSYDLCTLQGQIRHKVAFINENIPSHVKLFLIGHSIGCYIILKILDQLEHLVERCFMLFPTIERMALSPNGRIYTPALKYLRWIAPIAAYGLNMLPEYIKTWLVQRFLSGDSVPACVHSATLSLIKPFCVSNALFMAHQEMRIVADLDKDLVWKHSECLCFYFGKSDDWCPPQYHQEFKEEFPDFPADHIRKCEIGYKHAYVVEESVDVAQVVVDWFKSIYGDKYFVD